MSLAIFDLDNTLINGDSDHAWGEFLCEKGIVDKEEYGRANDYFYQQYVNGGLDINEFLEFALRPLAQMPKAELDALHEQFMQDKIAAMMLPKAKELLANHKAAGDCLLIITATNRFVTEPIAKALAVDEMLATEAEMIDGEYTGKVTDTPCFQEGKVTRLQQWLKNNDFDLEGSYFYSDSHNDLPLLKIVDNPVAVNPDETLEQYAAEQLWPVLDLR